jgi:hypothetical protein
MRQLTAAQLVRVLRKRAEYAEREGIMLLHESNRVKPGTDTSGWVVEESVGGEAPRYSNLFPPHQGGWWDCDGDEVVAAP